MTVSTSGAAAGGRRGPVRILAGFRAIAWLVAVVTTCPGCMVVSLNKFYADDAITFDERLLGSWKDADDNVTATIERSEWRSYRITYVHPIDKAQLTGYLFKDGETLYLDLAPVRGQDPGSLVLAGHTVARVEIKPGQMALQPLLYDWFAKGMKARTLPSALLAVPSERDQVVLAGPAAALQQWLAARTSADPAFGPPIVFTTDVAAK